MSEDSPRFTRIVAVRNIESDTNIERNVLYGLTASGAVWRTDSIGSHRRWAPKWIDLKAPAVMIDIAATPESHQSWEALFALDQDGQIWNLYFPTQMMFTPITTPSVQWKNISIPEAPQGIPAP